MSKVVYKEFRPLVNGIRRAVHVPYTLYTVDEADKLGIPYERNWRLQFRDLVDLTGKNIVTDDDPPYVVPVLSARVCRANPRTGDTRRPYRKLVLPWTHVSSYRRDLHVGVPATAVGPELANKRRKLKPVYFKLFVIFIALMGDPLKVVEQLFGYKTEVEQKRFFRGMMEDERTYDAASSVARTVLAEAGIDPKVVAEKLWEILEREGTPIHLKIKGYQDLLDRLGIKDKPQTPDVSGLIAGALFQQPLPGGMDGDLKSLLMKEVDNLPKGGNTRKRLAPVQSDTAGNRDERAEDALSPSESPPDPA